MTPSAFMYEVDASGCWLWQGYMDRNGYGRVYNRARRRVEWVHRYSYELHKGPIADRNEIDHTCQVTRCVNPDHLDQVTHVEHARRTMQRLGKDNLHLAAARLRRQGLTYAEVAELLGMAGRESAHSAVISAIDKGLVAADDVPRARHLTEQEREDIRLLYAFGFTQTSIARFYDMDSSQVSRICNGKTSGHTDRSLADVEPANDTGMRGGIDLRDLWDSEKRVGVLAAIAEARDAVKGKRGDAA